MLQTQGLDFSQGLEKSEFSDFNAGIPKCVNLYLDQKVPQYKDRGIQWISSRRHLLNYNFLAGSG